MSALALLVLPLLLLVATTAYALSPLLARLPPVLKHCRKRSRNLSRKEFNLPPRKREGALLPVRNLVVATVASASIVSLVAAWIYLATQDWPTQINNIARHRTDFTIASRILLALAVTPVPALVNVLMAFTLLRGRSQPHFVTLATGSGGVTEATLTTRIIPYATAVIALSIALAIISIVCLTALAGALAFLAPGLGVWCYFANRTKKWHTLRSNTPTSHKSQPSDFTQTSVAIPPAATPRTPERRKQRDRLRSHRHSADSWLSSPSNSVVSLPEWDFTVHPDTSTIAVDSLPTRVGSLGNRTVSSHAVATLNSTARGTPKPMPVASAYVLSSNNKRLSPKQWTFSGTAEMLADSEWEAVAALDGSEEWGRGDGAVGILAVVGVVLCYVSPRKWSAHSKALEVPLLVLGRHKATAALFITAVAIPAPFLAIAVWLMRRRHSPPMQTEKGNSKESGAIVNLTPHASKAPENTATSQGTAPPSSSLAAPQLHPSSHPKPVPPAAAKGDLYTVARSELLKPTPALVRSPRPAYHDVGPLCKGIGSDVPGITISDLDTSLSCDDHPLTAQIQYARRARRSPSPSYILEPARHRGDSSSTIGQSCLVNAYCMVGEESLQASSGQGSGSNKGVITGIASSKFKMSSSTVDFSQARASTPCRSSAAQADADLSMDWEAFDLPDVPPLPDKYSHGPFIASSTASHRVNLETSQDAEASIARNAALARMLADTPQREPASTASTPATMPDQDSYLSYSDTMTSFATRVAGFGKSVDNFSTPQTPSTPAVVPVTTPCPTTTIARPLPPLLSPSWSPNTRPVSYHSGMGTPESNRSPNSTHTRSHSNPSSVSSLRPLRLVQEQERLKLTRAKVVKQQSSRESVKSTTSISKSRAGAPGVLAPRSVNTSIPSSTSRTSLSVGSKMSLATGKMSAMSQSSLGLGLGLGLTMGPGVSVGELRRMGLPVPSRGGGAKMSVDKENVHWSGGRV